MRDILPDCYQRNKLAAMCLLLFFSCFVVTENLHAQTTDDEQTRVLIRRADQEMMNGNYRTALEIINNAIEQGIDDTYAKSIAYYIRSYSYWKTGRLDDALSDSLFSIDLILPQAGVSEYLPNSYELLAGIYSSMKRHQDSLDAINKAIDEAEKRGALELRFYANRALAYVNLHEFDPALADINYMLIIDPHNADALSAMVTLVTVVGKIVNPQEALSYLNQAIDANPNIAVFFFYRGEIYEVNEIYDGAFADYSRAIELGIQDPDAYRQRGLLNKKAGRYDDALADFSEGIRIAPGDEELRFERGLLYSEMGNFPGTLEDAREYFRLTEDEDGLKKLEEIEKEHDREMQLRLRELLEKNPAGDSKGQT
jgi:tetratricopeptide (TPR) repeat protein